MDRPGVFWLKDKMLLSGLIGRSIQDSRSPWLHEQEARAQGLDLSYELFDFDQLALADKELGSLLGRLSAGGYCGVNVTYPFKQIVMPLLDELDESARLVGAVNTIAMRGRKLTGHNTDMAGFYSSMQQSLAGAPLGQVIQLGAGGAGSAVACALLALGTKRLEIYDMDVARAQRLATSLAERFGQDRTAAADIASLSSTDGIDGIVNTTPMGMAAHPEAAIAPELISPKHWVADIVYFPLETELLRIARAKGCRVLNGSGMVIGQAAKAFEIMTGFPADKERMQTSFVLG